MGTTAKSALTREAILEGARAMFARKGYSGTTVSGITDGLHVTRANFYYYFRDKNEVFIELGTQTYRESLAAIESLDTLAQHPRPSEVHRWVREYFAYLDRNGAFVARSMDDGPDNPDFQTTVTRLHRKSALRLGLAITARSTAEFASPVALGMSIMAMLERSWLLAQSDSVALSRSAAIRSSAEVLLQIMR